MKKFLEFIASVIVFACIIYLGACFMDIVFSNDPVLPIPMHDWNIFKYLGNA